MNCPSCGCQTPEGRDWCDLCGAPLRKPERKTPAKKTAPISPALLGKLLEDRSRREPPRGPAEIPPEFAGFDPGERIPELSPRVRQLAWAFLGIVLFWMLAGSIWLVLRAHPLG